MLAWQSAGPARVASAQEQSPLFYGPSEVLRRIYYRISGPPHSTGVDVRSYEVCPDCGQMHDPAVECVQRAPVDDCVVGKKKMFNSSIRYEYVVIPEVRYRWRTKWITREVPADFDEPICNTEDKEATHNVESWTAEDNGVCKLYSKSAVPEPETVASKQLDTQPGKTTIRVRYKSCVKIPYTVYRQIKRPIAIKQPCTEKVEVPVTRYECQRLCTE